MEMDVNGFSYMFFSYVFLQYMVFALSISDVLETVRL